MLGAIAQHSFLSSQTLRVRRVGPGRKIRMQLVGCLLELALTRIQISQVDVCRDGAPGVDLEGLDQRIPGSLTPVQGEIGDPKKQVRVGDTGLDRSGAFKISDGISEVLLLEFAIAGAAQRGSMVLVEFQSPLKIIPRLPDLALCDPQLASFRQSLNVL